MNARARIMPMVLLSSAIAATACAQAVHRAAQRQTEAAGQIGERQGGSERTGMVQIARPTADTRVGAIGVERRSTAVSQLPPLLEIGPNETAPETELEAAPVDPDRALQAEVLRTWQSLRQRGQQPTPELVAKEIGPEALARFLATSPGAERLFDGHTAPPAPPPTPTPVDSEPDGGRP
jgi:hypothetical protein